MEFYVAHVLVSLALCFGNNLIHGYPDGAPTDACTTLLPAHAITAIEGYTLVAEQASFNPGNSLTLSVAFTTEMLGFNGVIMQVRSPFGAKAGTFDESDLFKTIACDSSGDTLTHKSSTTKNGGSFVWNAPASCEDGETYTVQATFVKNFEEYQSGLQVELTCSVPETSSETVATQCSHSNLTSLPTHGYREDFESTSSPNNWVNSNSNIAWRRNMGNTPSTNTGPDGAAEGDYYIYFETSSPRAAGDMVVLETNEPADIRGCVCLMLQLSFNVQDNSGHTFQIFVGVEVAYESGDSHEWKSVKVQIDTDVFVKIRMVGTRGRSWQGDTAVDDISIVEGLCPS